MLLSQYCVAAVHDVACVAMNALERYMVCCFGLCYAVAVSVALLLVAHLAWLVAWFSCPPCHNQCVYIIHLSLGSSNSSKWESWGLHSNRGVCPSHPDDAIADILVGCVVAGSNAKQVRILFKCG
jgi:hypothetical protein